jgi:hypothetical protein
MKFRRGKFLISRLSFEDVCEDAWLAGHAGQSDREYRILNQNRSS